MPLHYTWVKGLPTYGLGPPRVVEGASPASRVTHLLPGSGSTACALHRLYCSGTMSALALGGSDYQNPLGRWWLRSAGPTLSSCWPQSHGEPELPQFGLCSFWVIARSNHKVGTRAAGTRVSAGLVPRGPSGGSAGVRTQGTVARIATILLVGQP